MGRISLITETWNAGRNITGCEYLEDEKEIPDTCDSDIHYWVTIDGTPPLEKSQCLCGKTIYRSG